MFKNGILKAGMFKSLALWTPSSFKKLHQIFMNYPAANYGVSAKEFSASFSQQAAGRSWKFSHLFVQRPSLRFHPLPGGAMPRTTKNPAPTAIADGSMDAFLTLVKS